MISINEAAAQGILLLRKQIWVNPFDHLRIDVIDGCKGPWAYLHSPMNKAINRVDPVPLLLIMFDREELNRKEWLPYEGPLPDSTEYAEEELKFDTAFFVR